MAPAAVAAKKRGRPPSKTPPSPKKAAAAEPAAKKKAKTEDPFTDACGAFLALLEKDASLTESAREMLRSAAPFSLRPPKEERHKYQEQMTDTLEGILRSVLSKERFSVESTTKSLAETGEAVAAQATELEKAKEKVDELTGVLNASKAAVSDATTAVKEAKAALETARAAAESVEEEHAVNVNALVERELMVGETWTQLKDSVFAGRDWRKREKKIADIVEVLQEQNVEESLIACVPVSLKVVATKRGDFAQKSIEFAEEALKKSVEAIKENINAHDKKVAEHAQVVKDAEKALDAAKAALTTREEENVQAQNVALEATEAKTVVAQSKDASDSKHQELSGELEQQEKNLAEVSALVGRFEAIAAGGASAASSSVEDDGTEQTAAAAAE